LPNDPFSNGSNASQSNKHSNRNTLNDNPDNTIPRPPRTTDSSYTSARLPKDPFSKGSNASQSNKNSNSNTPNDNTILNLFRKYREAEENIVGAKARRRTTGGQQYDKTILINKSTQQNLIDSLKDAYKDVPLEEKEQTLKKLAVIATNSNTELQINFGEPFLSQMVIRKNIIDLLESGTKNGTNPVLNASEDPTVGGRRKSRSKKRSTRLRKKTRSRSRR